MENEGKKLIRDLVLRGLANIGDHEVISVLDEYTSGTLTKYRDAYDVLSRKCSDLAETVDRFVDRGCQRCGTLSTRGGPWIRLPNVARDLEDYDDRDVLRLCGDCQEAVIRSVVAAYLRRGDSCPTLDNLFAPILRSSPARRRHIERRESLDAYFADHPEVPGFVKIGCSVEAEQRVATLGLRLLLTEPGGVERERTLHARFAKLAIRPDDLPTPIPRDGRTEWFAREGSLAHYLAAVA